MNYAVCSSANYGPELIIQSDYLPVLFFNTIVIYNPPDFLEQMSAEKNDLIIRQMQRNNPGIVPLS